MLDVSHRINREMEDVDAYETLSRTSRYGMVVDNSFSKPPYDVTLLFAYAEYDSRSFYRHSNFIQLWPSRNSFTLAPRHPCLLRNVTICPNGTVARTAPSKNFSSLTFNLH
ncbi:GQ67_02276T0 [Komagataella phaffii]|nr:GQ67_02276T0 [Komagataella phaffii]AOA66165.1 GQ68_02971T0 [Komagataella phaffii GS115]